MISFDEDQLYSKYYNINRGYSPPLEITNYIKDVDNAIVELKRRKREVLKLKKRAEKLDDLYYKWAYSTDVDTDSKAGQATLTKLRKISTELTKIAISIGLVGTRDVDRLDWDGQEIE